MKTLTLIIVLTFCCCPIQAQVNLDGPGQYTQWESETAAVAETSQETRVRSTFHKQVLKAIPKAVQQNKLSKRDAMRLRFSMLSPAFRSRAKDLAVLQVLSSGEEIPTGIVDGVIDFEGEIWDQFFILLLQILIDLLNEILQGLGQ